MTRADRKLTYREDNADNATLLLRRLARLRPDMLQQDCKLVQEGIKSGNVSETCRRHGIAANLFYRWKDEAEQGAKAALGGRSAAAAETEKDHRIRQLERTLGRKSLEIEILKNVVGE